MAAPSPVDPIFSRMVSLPLRPLESENETMLSQLFREVVVHNGARRPRITLLGEGKRQAVLLRNISYHCVRFLFKDHKPLELLSKETKQVSLRPADLIYPPMVEYVQAEFFEAKFSLRDFQEDPKGTFTFTLNFLQFPLIQFGQDGEGEYELILQCEAEAGILVHPEKTTFLLEREVKCYPYEERLHPNSEDYNIYVLFRDGTEEFYGRFLEEEPQRIKAIRMRMWDGRVAKQIILLAKN